MKLLTQAASSINGKFEVQGAEEPEAFLQVFVSLVLDLLSKLSLTATLTSG